MRWQHVVSICSMGLILLLQVAAVVDDLLRTKFKLTGSRFQCCRKSSAQPSQDTSKRVERLIGERVADMRARYMIDMSRMWTHVCGIFAILHFVWMLLQSELHTDGVREILIGMSYVIALACRVHPPVVNQYTLWMLHSAFMGLLMCDAIYIAIAIPGLFLACYPGTLVIRVILSLCYPAELQNLVWSAAWVLMLVMGYVRDDGPFQGAPWQYLLGNEVLFWGVMWFFVRRFQQLQVSLVRSERDANGYLQAKSMMQKMLSNMCHAVVELNQELEISRPCPKLAGLLIKADSPLAMQGESFPALLFSDTERDRFSKYVAQREVPVEQEESLVGEETASSIHVSLRDTIGNAVCVQVFHSCHQNPADDICHIVGVLEVEEAQDLGVQEFENTTIAEGLRDAQGAGVGAGDAQGGSRRSRTERARDTVSDLGLHVAPADDVESVVSSASASSVATGAVFSEMSIHMVPFIAEGTVAPMTVIFNPYTMEIIACTTRFQSITGPIVAKTRLGKFVVNFLEFRAWVLVEVNGAFMGMAPTKLPIILTPTMIKQQARFEFHADAYVYDVREKALASQLGVVWPAGAGEQKEHELLCVLCTNDPRPKWNGERSRGSPGSSEFEVVSEVVSEQREPADSVTLIEM